MIVHSAKLGFFFQDFWIGCRSVANNSNLPYQSLQYKCRINVKMGFIPKEQFLVSVRPAKHLSVLWVNVSPYECVFSGCSCSVNAWCSVTKAWTCVCSYNGRIGAIIGLLKVHCLKQNRKNGKCWHVIQPTMTLCSPSRPCRPPFDKIWSMRPTSRHNDTVQW